MFPEPRDVFQHVFLCHRHPFLQVDVLPVAIADKLSLMVFYEASNHQETSVMQYLLPDFTWKVWHGLSLTPLEGVFR